MGMRDKDIPRFQQNTDAQLKYLRCVMNAQTQQDMQSCELEFMKSINVEEFALTEMS